MGESDSPQGVDRLEYGIARLTLARKVVPELRNASSFLLSETVARVRAGKKIETASEIITLAASTSLIGALVADQDLAAKILAVVTFLSAVGNVVVEYILDLNNPRLA